MTPDFYDRDVLAVARELIGAEILVDGVGGVIVETEAYRHDDPASHSFRGLRVANAAMFGPPGTAYIYRSYGIHWCLNLVCRSGCAVLIRALHPTDGLPQMRERRGLFDLRKLCAGPGRLCSALAVTSALNGKSLYAPPFVLQARTTAPVVTGPRIGISKAKEEPWRFGLAGSLYWSRAFPLL